MESRLWTALALYTYAVVGAFLVLIPWTGVWGAAAQVLLPEAVATWITSGWVRGAASAIGALDLMVAGQVAWSLGRSGRQKKGGDEQSPPAKFSEER